MYNREIFWKFVELGLSCAKVNPEAAIRALARVMRREIDVYINGFAPPDLADMADKAVSYVRYVEGGPLPVWMVGFNNQFPEA